MKKHIVSLLIALFVATSAFGQAASPPDDLPIGGPGGGVPSNAPFEHPDDISCTEPGCTITAQPGLTGPAQTFALCESDEFIEGATRKCSTLIAPSDMEAQYTFNIAEVRNTVNTVNFPSTNMWGAQTYYPPSIIVDENSYVDVELSMNVRTQTSGNGHVVQWDYVGVQAFVNHIEDSNNYTYLFTTPVLCPFYNSAEDAFLTFTCTIPNIRIPANLNTTGTTDALVFGLELSNHLANTNFKLASDGARTIPGDVPAGGGTGTTGDGYSGNEAKYTLRADK